MGLGPPNYLSWSNNVLKKNCPICLVVIENVLFLKLIFYGKMCSRIFLSFGYENCKDFTMKDGERLI